MISAFIQLDSANSIHCVSLPANRILLFAKNPLQVHWQHPIRWLPLDGFPPCGHVTSGVMSLVVIEFACSVATTVGSKDRLSPKERYVAVKINN